jgi:hypothetical protein
MKIKALDHLVLTVADVDASCALSRSATIRLDAAATSQRSDGFSMSFTAS